MRRSLLAAAVSVVLLSGCGELPDIPPLPDPVAIGETAAVQTPTPGTTTLSPDGFRTTERVAVRVRNVGCGGVSTGSGFAVSEDVLVTNRHVVAGAETMQVSTYDGQDLLVETAGSAIVADLAIVRTRSVLPAAVTLAEADPEPGDPVEVVGYPGGGRLTSSTGTVLGYEADPLNANAGQIIVTDARAEPGSSGSPMYDESGQVVGVVYAATEDTTRSLAVPVSTLRTLLDETSFDDGVPPCE
jgi:S1-C subfamily serine protease